MSIAVSVPRARRTGGFSLVELLVVIGVITLLAGLLLAAVSVVRRGAQVASCGNNLSQIYKGARIYCNNYENALPDLYAGMVYPKDDEWFTDANRVMEWYVKSHHCRNTSGEGEGAGEEAAGLWLLFVYRYCEAEKVFYCPEIEGPLRYDGSDNRADENGVPEKVGYAYNYFPAPLTPADRAPIYPEDVEELDCSNDITEPRSMSFYALLSDVFLRSDQMTHQERKGLNACHWDGSVQWVDLQARAILWNATMTNDDGDEVDTFDTTGSLPSSARAVADTWALISKVRR